MSTKLRVVMVVVLWGFLAAGYLTEDRSHFGVGVGIGLVLAAALVEERIRNRRSTPRPDHFEFCQEDPADFHPCVLNRHDGHTTHRCAFGDCSWGY